MYLTNIIKAPTNEQRRRISSSNPTIRSIQKNEVFTQFLTTTGFTLSWQWCALELACSCDEAPITKPADANNGQNPPCQCPCAERKQKDEELWSANANNHNSLSQHNGDCICGTLYRVQYSLNLLISILVNANTANTTTAAAAAPANPAV